MHAILPYSYLFILGGLVTLTCLELSPERLVVSFSTLILFIFFWFFERKKLHIYNPYNKPLEQFEQSLATLGDYDREYTEWLGSRHGQSILLGYAKFSAFVALIIDIYAQIFHNYKIISIYTIEKIILPMLGINLGLGY
ncbi:MAG: hypothetical protein INF43_01190 [Alphaproteobacteria bacterium]|jgi:hypothetical protein|nr:hypothetical protein [Alphaproteobacteria bacterium]